MRKVRRHQRHRIDLLMPTIVTHGFFAALLGKSFAAGQMPARFWLLSPLCSILPDADVLGFPLGISYDNVLGHRGLSHSLAFALVLSLIASFLALPRVSAKVDEGFPAFLLLRCDDIARHFGRDDRWRAGRCIFRALRRYALLFSVPPYQSLTYRTLILQRPRARCNLERVPVGVHSRHHYRRRGHQPPQASTASRQSGGRIVSD